MRTTWIYVGGIVVLILVLLGLQWLLPSRFDWTPSFAHKDKNPFGCYVFDSVMVQTMPQGYRAEGLTLRQAIQSKAGHNVLIMAEKIALTKANITDIEKLLKQGATVMLVANYIDDNYQLAERFGIDVSNWNSFRLDEAQQLLAHQEKEAYDTICYAPRHNTGAGKKYAPSIGDAYPPAQYRILRSIAGGNVTYFSKDIRRYRLTPISYAPNQESHDANERVCRAIVCQRGKGRLVVVATPLLFTNYGVLAPSVRPYVMRLMNLLAQQPTVRLDSSLTQGAVTGAEADKHNQSALSYIISQPPLRWAYYATLIGVLLFFVFTARRRQRIIPIIPAPKNHDMEFVQLIGRLYYEHHDNTDLVMKKWNLMADVLRNQLDIDLTNQHQLQDNIAEVATATGMDKPTIGQLLTEVANIRNNALQVSDADMTRLINLMNSIVKSL